MAIARFTDNSISDREKGVKLTNTITRVVTQYLLFHDRCEECNAWLDKRLHKLTQY